MSKQDIQQDTKQDVEQNENPIAYVEHPVTKEEKKKIRSRGFKVVDARYRPEKIRKVDKIMMKPKPKDDEKAQ